MDLRTVWADGDVAPAPRLDQHLSLLDGVDDLPVQKLMAQLAAECFDLAGNPPITVAPVLPGQRDPFGDQGRLVVRCAGNAALGRAHLAENRFFGIARPPHERSSRKTMPRPNQIHGIGPNGSLDDSYYVEARTEETEREITTILDKVDAVQGTNKAFERGWFQPKIAAFACRTAGNAQSCCAQKR